MHIQPMTLDPLSVSYLPSQELNRDADTVGLSRFARHLGLVDYPLLVYCPSSDNL